MLRKLVFNIAARFFLHKCRMQHYGIVAVGTLFTEASYRLMLVPNAGRPDASKSYI